MNRSVTSYSPWQRVALLETEGMRYDPDVIVRVCCLNDYVEEFYLSRSGGYSSGPYKLVSPMLSGSGLYRAMRLLRDRGRGSDDSSRKELFDGYSDTRLIDQPYARQFKDAWRITFKNMSRMVAIAKRHERRFAIVCFPHAVQIQPGAVEQPHPPARLAESARVHEVPYLDLLPAFRTYLREYQVDVEDLFLNSSHPTGLGHAIAGQRIHAFSLQHGFSRWMKKGTGSELIPDHTTRKRPGRGACTLSQPQIEMALLRRLHASKPLTRRIPLGEIACGNGPT